MKELRDVLFARKLVGAPKAQSFIHSLTSFLQFIFKIILMGNSAVGKTCLVGRFTDNEFKRDSKSTIGVEFSTKSVQVGDKSVKAQIWDTAGQERYRSIASSYFRGAVGAFLVYDVTDSSSFDDLHVWLKEIQDNAEEVCMYLPTYARDTSSQPSLSNEKRFFS
jgi:small GTP-binding protein